MVSRKYSRSAGSSAYSRQMLNPLCCAYPRKKVRCEILSVFNVLYQSTLQGTAVGDARCRLPKVMSA